MVAFLIPPNICVAVIVLKDPVPNTAPLYPAVLGHGKGHQMLAEHTSNSPELCFLSK